MMGEGSWETPLGRVKLDTELARAIFDAAGVIDYDEAAFIREHSVEVQVPFLQYIYGEFKLVPICMGYQDLETSREVGEAIHRAADSKNILVVASTDLTHQEPQQSANRKDRMIIDAILAMDEERLQRVGLFEGASVEVDPDPAGAAAAPVLVHVKELPLQQATVGVGYSANTGQRVTLEHTHRRPFGIEWVARNKLELGRDLSAWEGELISHPLEGLYRNLVSGSAERLRGEGEVRTTWTARLGRTQDTPRIERLYFAEATHVRLDNYTTGRSNTNAYSGNYHWIYRDLDSVLLPTRGFTLSAQTAAGYALSSPAANGPFGRAYGRITWYQPLGAAWYATARLEAGQVIARDDVGVPDTMLFRAGGDESVRGYAYRTLGPDVVGPNGAVALGSGRMLLTASAEIARPISARRPAFWWAAFVDAGNAANHWNDLNPALGYGVGLRWRSPVGPLRLDLAYGQEVHKARLHLSVGIAF